MLIRYPWLPASRVAGLVAATLLVAACENDATSPNPTPVTAEITVDASAAFAYLALGTPAQLVSVADQSSSTAWDVGFYATTVTLNGGAAGPGGVEGYCLCGNASATNTDLEAMTAENQLAAFEAVTADSVPESGTWTSDALSPAVGGWYSGSGATAVPNASRSWILREGSPTAVLSKFRVTGFTGASTAGPASVTFEFAVQPSAGSAFGATQTATVSLASGPAYYDLTTGALTSSADWDLRFEGWTIRVNGGVSGSGTVSAVPDDTTPFTQIDAAYAATAPAQAFRRDSYSGVFAASPWYRYNITGTDNQIWPTFNVYLIRRGTEVFKVQLVGYYDAAATPRQITVRYARLTN